MSKDHDAPRRWMPGLPGKYTGQYMAEKGFELVRKVPTPTAASPYRDPASRMGWRVWPRTKWTAEAFAQTIVQASNTNALFFVDTNFFSTPLDDCVWDALLSRTIALPPLVRSELQPWLANPRHNGSIRDQVKAAVDGGHPRFLVDFDATYLDFGLHYYMRLLMLRKLVGIKLEGDFKNRCGRPPTKAELFASASKLVKDRGAVLAWKGAAEKNRPNLWADEELVVLAALTAFMMGREVTVLTRDHDVQEQFYKLLYLMELHYRSMLLADGYGSKPTHNSPVEIPAEGNCDPYQRFLGAGNMVFDPGFRSPFGWTEVLPLKSASVLVQCQWFTGGPKDLEFCSVEFNADTEMARILRIKAETDGLNTRAFDGLNCHVTPYPDHDELRFLAAIGRDRMVDVFGLFNCRTVDFIHAVECVERYEMVEWE